MKITRVVLFLVGSVLLLGCVDRAKYLEHTDAGIEVGGHPVVVKNIPALNFLYQPARIKKTRIKERSTEIARELFTQVATQEGINIIGPLTYVMDDLVNNSMDIADLHVGFPVDAAPGAAGESRFQMLDPFRCLTIRVPVDEKYTRVLWLRLNQVAYKKGYVPTGEGRTVITFNDTGSNYIMELQLGIKP